MLYDSTNCKHPINIKNNNYCYNFQNFYMFNTNIKFKKKFQIIILYFIFDIKIMLYLQCPQSFIKNIHFIIMIPMCIFTSIFINPCNTFQLNVYATLDYISKVYYFIYSTPISHLLFRSSFLSLSLSSSCSSSCFFFFFSVSFSLFLFRDLD